jgi:23S rRNA pseudouridine1911/1915/1917 synthase
VDEAGPIELSAPPGAGRLDAWLAEQLPVSRSRLKAMIRAGEVRVDGQVARPSMKLKGGETVYVPPPPLPTTTLEPQDIDVPLLHIDDHLLVVDKPAGLVVHPAPGHPDGTLVNAVLHLLEPLRAELQGAPQGQRIRPGVVHRLDRGTSGVLVMARRPEAHAHLAAQFAAHSTDRRYRALVHGRASDSGTIDAPLGRHGRERVRFSVVEGGKRAVTHWSRLGLGHHGVAGDAQGGKLSLLECRLETGRTHQIRVHLKHLGHPVVGDPLYAPKKQLPSSILARTGPLEHQLLHAQFLGFEHPVTGERMCFESALPPLFRSVLEAVKLVEQAD